jgi:hypothetical protein
MEKRGRILIAAAAVLAIGIIAWAFFGGRSVPPEPMYKGKPLSYWLQAYDPVSGGTNRPSRAYADAAIKHAGTNAIPLLLQMFRAHESPLKTKLLRWASRYAYLREHFRSANELNMEAYSGFAVLGGDAAGAVPELIKLVDDTHDDGRATLPILILLRLGPAAHDAVPSLLRAATSTNQSTRGMALAALGQIHANPQAVVPILRSALHDPSANIPAYAAGGLGSFRGQAAPAVPDLVAILREPDGGPNSVPLEPRMSTMSVRTVVEDALKRIDPDTYARVVTNASPR